MFLRSLKTLGTVDWVRQLSCTIFVPEKKNLGCAVVKMCSLGLVHLHLKAILPWHGNLKLSLPV